MTAAGAAPRTSPLFPDVSILDLSKQGVFTRSLMRYWFSRPEYQHPAPRYEYVLRSEGFAPYIIPVTRLQAAQILVGERAAAGTEGQR